MSPFALYKYISHRVVRWWGGPLAALSALFGLLFVGVAFGALWALGLLAAALLLFWLSTRMTIRGLSQVREAVRAIVATTLGVFDALRGVRYQTWQPAESR